MNLGTSMNKRCKLMRTEQATAENGRKLSLHFFCSAEVEDSWARSVSAFSHQSLPPKVVAQTPHTMSILGNQFD